MASVSYGKCIMANVIMAKIFMANKTETNRYRQPDSIGIDNQTDRYTPRQIGKL